MSNIFNAIQKAEYEQPGSEAVGDNEATELLERMERRTTSRWQSELGPIDSQRAKALNGGGSLLTIETIGVETESEEQAIGEPIRDSLLETTQVAAYLQQFQTIECTVAPQSRIVSLTEQEHPAIEAYRLLALRLQKLRKTKNLTKLLVTSSIPQEGKSLIAASLACALAEDGHQNVLLLDGDLRRPTLARILGLEVSSGVSEWLQGKAEITDCIYRLQKPGFWIMPAGMVKGKSSEAPLSGKLSSLIDVLTGLFDWIVIDAPPVLPLVDTSVWAQLVDGVLLVARQGVAQKRQLRQSIKALPSEKLLGALLNCSTSQTLYSYDYNSPSDVKKTRGSSAR